MARVMRNAVARWPQSQSFSWAREMESMACVVWADNVWLMSDNVELLQARITAVVECGMEFNMSWGGDSLQWLPNEAA